MIHKFHPDKNRWDGVEHHIYKENPGVFREVTKQILFDNENDLPVQFRYFQVEKNGFSSLEHHKHMHAVMIFKGKGHVLLGNQLRADRGEILGFLCLVNHDRDIPKYPTEEDLAEIRKNPEAAAFFDGTLKD